MGTVMRDGKIKKRSGKKGALCALVFLFAALCSTAAAAAPAAERADAAAAFEASRLAALAGTLCFVLLLGDDVAPIIPIDIFF